jgi:hypothetical protein
MPDINGNLLPPIPDEAFDGAKESKEIIFTKCQHALNFISPTELRCLKCGVGYTGTSREMSEIKKLFEKN